jgi:hypothetical protein
VRPRSVSARTLRIWHLAVQLQIQLAGGACAGAPADQQHIGLGAAIRVAQAS